MSGSGKTAKGPENLPPMCRIPTDAPGPLVRGMEWGGEEGGSEPPGIRAGRLGLERRVIVHVTRAPAFSSLSFLDHLSLGL